MDVHQLEVFLAVMNSSSMTRAAETIHLSPGAVSVQLHNLASEVQAELFVHKGKRLVPTPAAIRLAEHARAVVKLMNQIGQEFELDGAKDTRPFQFATGVTTLIYQLGGPLRQLRRQFPNADIGVTVGVTEQIVAGLLERRFDLGLILSRLRKTILESSRYLTKSFWSFVHRLKRFVAAASGRCRFLSSPTLPFCFTPNAAISAE